MITVAFWCFQAWAWTEVGTDAMELLGLYDQAAEVNVTRTAVTRSLRPVSLAVVPR